MAATGDRSFVMVRVLGPVDVLRVDGPRAVGGRLERTLLAALALSANHAVSSDQLAEIIWDGAPPPSRDNTLQTYVSRLRSLLGADTIRSEDHSYTLTVGRDQVDALVFEDLTTAITGSAADPVRRLDRCREALALWRGTPFGELADVDPFRLEAIRLDELRVVVVEERLTCEIALGRERTAVGAIEALAEEFPYRERIWHLLIGALALAGRRTEAIRAFHELRDRLADVGLEPIRQVRTLHESILDEADDIRDQVVATLGGPCRVW